MTIPSAGFKTFSVSNLQVNVGETPKVDANLEVGSLNQSITVAARVQRLYRLFPLPRDCSQHYPLQVAKTVARIGSAFGSKGAGFELVTLLSVL